MNKSNYPQAYKDIRTLENKSATIFLATIIFGFLLFGSIWGHLFAAGIFIIPLIGLLFSFISLKTQTSRITPYFDKQFPHDYSHLTHGENLLKHVNLLDDYLSSENERELSSFGYNHKLRGKSIKWHDPDDALKTLKKLINSLPTDRINSEETEALTSDIKNLYEVLKSAKSSKAKFTLLIRSGESVSLYEVEKGDGYF